MSDVGKPDLNGSKTNFAGVNFTGANLEGMKSETGTKIPQSDANQGFFTSRFHQEEAISQKTHVEKVREQDQKEQSLEHTVNRSL